MPNLVDETETMDPESAIARGDQSARSGEWSGAIDQWRNALNGADAAKASQRIRWFLQETNRHSSGSTGTVHRRQHAYRVFFGAAVASAIGTAVALVGIDRSGAESALLAAAAWTCFAISIALSLVFARLLGWQTDRQPLLAFGDQAVAVAMNVAATLDQIRNPEEQVVHPGPTPVRK